ncbi:hypothetical protein DES40_1707 [Litorimonas taeanensis]|uniref:Uncharacterized protein n=1 Tax=Litorimonas taeanensis TaxID=568099 RepID=A0A420WD41_9PROT|nr:hypothetical protein [Litorimonas taeanensis]RKQ68931.1 hypothetical protein DES40_1707 [Litorimonas taeanensis]
MILDTLNNNLITEITLFILLFVGVLLTFGNGNWRHVVHRYASKPRLKRLSEDAKRVAEDIANTISQQNAREYEQLNQEWHERREGINRPMRRITQDQRYLSKHMMESHSVIQRLKQVGYWNPDKYFSEIGIAGATGFAAESTSKALFSASEQIRCDLEDGFLTIITQPKLPQDDKSRARS